MALFLVTSRYDDSYVDTARTPELQEYLLRNLVDKVRELIPIYTGVINEKSNRPAHH